MTSPLVSFIGAGPGDPELITLKGLRRLREADVIIHDRLIPRALLEEAPADAEIIDVGKAPGRHCVGQSEINWLLVDRARRRPRIARLKGGDPAVFGRLGEEIAAVRAAGIPCEIVPGVTAATAAAAVAGLSLTERGTTPMVVLATGTDHTGRLPSALDWPSLAHADATLVFYMGVAGLTTITSTLIALGRDPREPAVIVERAGMPGERTVTGHLGEIAALAAAAAVAAPAVLVTGPTVGAVDATTRPSRWPAAQTATSPMEGEPAWRM
jgi:uroporphyrin-III C-methyltransferase